MFKQSILKKISLLFFYFVLGIGIGVVSTIPLVVMNLIPDDGDLILAIGLPIAALIIVYQFISLTNTLEITETGVIVTSVFKKRQEFRYEEYHMIPGLGGFSMYGAPLVEFLRLRFVSKADGKKKLIKFGGYKRKTIDEIIELMVSYNPEMLEEA